MLATAPSVLYGIFRYLYLIYDREDTRSTAAILTEDPGMIFAAVTWVATALLMLYVVRLGVAPPTSGRPIGVRRRRASAGRIAERQCRHAPGTGPSLGPAQPVVRPCHQPGGAAAGRIDSRRPIEPAPVDLTLTPDEQAFRDELRAWLEENHPGPAPQGGDQVQYEFEREWQRKLHAGGWAGVVVAEGVRRPRRDADRAVDLRRGARASQGAAARRTSSGS